MRPTPLIALSLLACMAFGCKKASTPEPIDDDAAPAAAADVATAAEGADAESATGGGEGGEVAEATDAASASEPTGSGAGDAGTTIADDAAAVTSDDAGHATEKTEASAAATGKPADPNPTAPGAPAGTVEIVVHSAAGGTGEGAVSAALEKSKQRLRGCYGKALASDPSTSGVLKLRATISPEGAVEKVDVIGGTLSPSPLVQCTVATAKSAKIAGAAAPQTKASFDVKFSK